MKTVFIIMEAYEKGHKPYGYVNTVWEDLDKARTVARYLKEANKDEDFYENWILERVVL